MLHLKDKYLSHIVYEKKKVRFNPQRACSLRYSFLSFQSSISNENSYTARSKVLVEIIKFAFCTTTVCDFLQRGTELHEEVDVGAERGSAGGCRRVKQ